MKLKYWQTKAKQKTNKPENEANLTYNEKQIFVAIYARFVWN